MPYYQRGAGYICIFFLLFGDGKCFLRSNPLISLVEDWVINDSLPLMSEFDFHIIVGNAFTPHKRIAAENVRLEQQKMLFFFGNDCVPNTILTENGFR